MERVTSQSHAEVIGEALEYLPGRIRELAGTDFFCADPIFAGLHHFEEATFGRSYRTTAHACSPHHTTDRRYVIVLPVVETIPVVLHELGHVLDGQLAERSGSAPTFAPVTEYARTNREEAFAEAFTAWFYPPDYRDPWFAFDAESRAFFDHLAVSD